MDNDICKLELFSFSLRDNATTWLTSLPGNSIDSRDKCKDAFIAKYFPHSKIISLRNQIILRNLSKNMSHNLGSKWLMDRNCLAHGLSLWMMIQNFYAGINLVSRNVLYTAAGGTFMGITLG